ncbi:uroporphyrinogen-III C-methyltransferase [Providencia huaxiensis]
MKRISTAACKSCKRTLLRYLALMLKVGYLVQADFMVKMAGRKLWNDRDPVTAAVLLKSADSSLAK